MKTMKKLLSLLCAGALTLTAANFSPTAEKALIRVACVGDSITAGNKSSDNATCSYPAQLQNLLDSSLYEVENFGHTGAAALRDVTARTPYRTTAAYTKSLAYQPNIVIIMLGTNDVVCNARFNEENYFKDLGDLVKEYQELASHPTVYLCTPPVASDTNHPAPLQNVAVPTVKKIAEATGAVLVDVNTETTDYYKNGLIADYIHPNDAGYLSLARFFYETVFGKKAATLTVKAKPGLTASIGGQKVTVDDNGIARLIAGEGTKTLRLSEQSGGFHDFPVTVSADTVADCTALEVPENLARASGVTPVYTVLREGDSYKQNFVPANAFDGSESTGWQLDTAYGYAYGIFIGCDFGTAQTVNTIELVLEQGSLPGSYVAETSADGETWSEIPNAKNTLASARAVISFPALSTRYIRVRFLSGTTMYRPKVWEMRVTNDQTSGFVPVITSGTLPDEMPAILRVACVGDSITEGIGSSSLVYNSYPSQLAVLLDSKRYQIGKFGTSGRAAMKVTNSDVYVPYWNDANFNKSKEFLPNIVLLMLGTNDVMCDTWSVDAYYEGIKGLIEAYQSLSSHPTVWVFTPMHAFDEKHPARLEEGIPYLKQAVNETGARLLDVYSLTADYYSKGFVNGGNDLVHLTDAGYLAFAELIYENVFGGKTTTLTVTAKPGYRVSLGGQKKTVPASGTVIFDAGESGTKTLTVEDIGKGYASVAVPMHGRTYADLSGLVISENLAFGAYVLCSTTEKLKNRINDGDLTEGWQEQENSDYADNWIGYDFGEKVSFDTVELLWEASTRAPEGGYTLQTSSDGVTWTDIANAVYQIGEKDDVVTFPTQTSRYLRLKITAGTNNKYKPHIYEMRAFLSPPPFTPTFTYDLLLGDVTGDGYVTAEDLTALARHVGGIETLTATLGLADVDGNRSVDADDLTKLARFVGGIDKTL